MPITDNLGVLVVVILIGLIARKSGLIEAVAGKFIAQLIMNVTLPLLLLSSFTFDYTAEIRKTMYLLILIAIIVISLVVLICELIFYFVDPNDKQKSALKFLLVFGNTTFVGFPLSYLFYGQEGLFLAAVYNVIHMIVMWTYGIRLFNRTKTNIGMLSLLFREPTFLAILISIVFAVLSIRLPANILTIFDFVGSATVPLSFLLVGIMLNFATVKYKQMLNVLLIAVIRLLIIPFSVLLILKSFNFPELMIGVIVIMVGTPSAVLATAFAEKYKGDYELASAGVLTTTMLAVLTLPLLYYLL